MPTGPKKPTRSNNARVGDWSRTPAPKPAKKVDAPNTYRVKSGDNLTSIAKKYGTSVNALYKMNPALAARKAAGKVTIFSNSLIRLPGKSNNISAETRRENKGRSASSSVPKPSTVSKPDYASLNAANASGLKAIKNASKPKSTVSKPKRTTTRGN